MDFTPEYRSLPTPSASISEISPTTNPMHDDATPQNANPSTTSRNDKQYNAHYTTATPAAKDNQQPPVPARRPNNRHAFDPAAITSKKHPSYPKQPKATDIEIQRLCENDKRRKGDNRAIFTHSREASSYSIPRRNALDGKLDCLISAIANINSGMHRMLACLDNVENEASSPSRSTSITLPCTTPQHNAPVQLQPDPSEAQILQDRINDVLAEMKYWRS
jgi:hypothetical protein